MFGYAPSQVRKFLISAAGFAVTLLTTVLAVGPDLIPDNAVPYINAFVAVCASYGVFKVENRPADGQPSDPAASEVG